MQIKNLDKQQAVDIAQNEWKEAEDIRLIIGKSDLSDDHYRRAYAIADEKYKELLRIKGLLKGVSA